MENGQFIGIFPVKMVILHSYVKLPEGMLGLCNKSSNGYRGIAATAP